jgi:hypothetical protein
MKLQPLRFPLKFTPVSAEKYTCATAVISETSTPCVSGHPPVAGGHHDWFRFRGIGTVTPAQPEFHSGAGGRHGALRVPIQS